MRRSPRLSSFLLPLLLVGCAIDPGLPWPPEALVADLRTCYGIDRPFAYYAGRFEDQQHKGRADYSFTNSFGFGLESGLAKDASYAKLLPGDEPDQIWLDVYSGSQARLHRTKLRKARIVECQPTKTVVIYEGAHAAEGSRAHYRYTVTYSPLDGGASVDSQAVYTSAWLLFKTTEYWRTWAHFKSGG